MPTPVGNLDYMTFRAVQVLKDADLILAEDTRTSGVLLKHFDIHTPMRSHHKFNEHEEAPRIAERILGGETIALISDAGTPGISDPGFMLSRECRKVGADVECLVQLGNLTADAGLTVGTEKFSQLTECATEPFRRFIYHHRPRVGSQE